MSLCLLCYCIWICPYQYAIHKMYTVYKSILWPYMCGILSFKALLTCTTFMCSSIGQRFIQNGWIGVLFLSDWVGFFVIFILAENLNISTTLQTVDKWSARTMVYSFNEDFCSTYMYQYTGTELPCTFWPNLKDNYALAESWLLYWFIYCPKDTWFWKLVVNLV